MSKLKRYENGPLMAKDGKLISNCDCCECSQWQSFWQSECQEDGTRAWVEVESERKLGPCNKAEMSKRCWRNISGNYCYLYGNHQYGTNPPYDLPGEIVFTNPDEGLAACAKRRWAADYFVNRVSISLCERAKSGDRYQPSPPDLPDEACYVASTECDGVIYGPIHYAENVPNDIDMTILPAVTTELCDACNPLILKQIRRDASFICTGPEIGNWTYSDTTINCQTGIPINTWIKTSDGTFPTYYCLGECGLLESGPLKPPAPPALADLSSSCPPDGCTMPDAMPVHDCFAYSQSRIYSTPEANEGLWIYGAFADDYHGDNSGAFDVYLQYCKCEGSQFVPFGTEYKTTVQGSNASWTKLFRLYYIDSHAIFNRNIIFRIRATGTVIWKTDPAPKFKEYKSWPWGPYNKSEAGSCDGVPCDTCYYLALKLSW